VFTGFLEAAEQTLCAPIPAPLADQSSASSKPRLRQLHASWHQLWTPQRQQQADCRSESSRNFRPRTQQHGGIRQRTSPDSGTAHRCDLRVPGAILPSSGSSSPAPTVAVAYTR